MVLHAIDDLTICVTQVINLLVYKISPSQNILIACQCTIHVLFMNDVHYINAITSSGECPYDWGTWEVSQVIIIFTLSTCFIALHYWIHHVLFMKICKDYLKNHWTKSRLVCIHFHVFSMLIPNIDIIFDNPEFKKKTVRCSRHSQPYYKRVNEAVSDRWTWTCLAFYFLKTFAPLAGGLFLFIQVHLRMPL